MSKRETEIELSPLDQIRQTESEVTRKIAAAREAAEHIMENARQQADTLKRCAREAGTREGEGLYKTTIARSEEEARTLVVAAGFEAERLKRKGEKQMKRGANYAVNFVLGLMEETENP